MGGCYDYLLCRSEQTLFLKGSYSLCAHLELNLLAVDYNGFLLQVGLPHLFCMAQREANIIAVLAAFTEYIAFAHSLWFLLVQLYILAVFTS
jgi:hypothetical protein